jgi:hypothetical protein
MGFVWCSLKNDPVCHRLIYPVLTLSSRKFLELSLMPMGLKKEAASSAVFLQFPSLGLLRRSSYGYEG